MLLLLSLRLLLKFCHLLHFLLKTLLFKPNAGLTHQKLLQKDITLSAKIEQRETKLFDFFSTCNNFRKK